MTLTPRQDALYAILCDNAERSNVGLSLDNMGDSLGGVSGPTVLHLLKKLEERGFIRRHPGRARSVEIVARDLCPHCHQSIGSEACRNAAANTVTTYSLTPAQPARAA